MEGKLFSETYPFANVLDHFSGYSCLGDYSNHGWLVGYAFTESFNSTVKVFIPNLCMGKGWKNLSGTFHG